MALLKENLPLLLTIVFLTVYPLSWLYSMGNL